jgi:hypothetical protein
MSIAGLLDSIADALSAIVPTTAPGVRFVVHDQLTSEADMLGLVTVAAQRSAYIGASAPVDTGLVYGDTVDEVSHALTVTVLYRIGEMPDAEGAMREDAVAIMRALRPASVWAAHANDVAVLPDTSSEVLSDEQQDFARVLRVQLTARIPV